MILFVTGPLHSGKTTFVRQLIRRLNTQDLSPGGYITPAVFENDFRIGYDLLALKTNRRCSFLRLKGNPGWPQVGNYFFVPPGLEIASDIITHCREDICIIDEIGPMEINGGGLWTPILKLLSHRTSPTLFVIRESLVDRFTALFPDKPVFVFDIRKNNAASRIYSLLKSVER